MVEPVPAHLHTVVPRMVFDDARAAIAFYEKAFGAELVDEPFADPAGKIVHAEVRIGDSVVFVTDEGCDGNGVAPRSVGGRVTSIMTLNVPDVAASASFAKTHFGFEEAMSAEGFVSLQHPGSPPNVIFLETGLSTFRPREGAGHPSLRPSAIRFCGRGG